MEDWEKDWKEHLKVCTHDCKDTVKQKDIFYVGRQSVENLLKYATRFDFPNSVAVEFRDVNKWAVICGGCCLNNKGGWEYERQPSSRTDNFKKRTRFSLRKAVKLAQAIKPENKR